MVGEVAVDLLQRSEAVIAAGPARAALTQEIGFEECDKPLEK
jgi:hypothetical protein